MYTTQTNQVLHHLRTRGRLTQREAMNLYGIMRLTSIFRIRRRFLQMHGAIDTAFIGSGYCSHAA